MSEIRILIEEIIIELTKIEKGELSYNHNGHHIELPRLIGGGELGSLRVTAEIDHKINKVADILIVEDKDIKKKFKFNEWRSLVRNSFGAPLLSIDLDLTAESNAEYVEFELRKRTESYTKQQKSCEFAVGCTFLNGEKPLSFAIGPVSFEHRLEWIKRKEHEKAISTITRRRVEKKWSGAKLVARKDSWDALTEGFIFSAIADYPYVCSVKSNYFGREISQDRAVVVANLALCSIALLWKPPSRTLDSLNLLCDGPSYVKNILFHPKGQRLLVGKYREKLPFGPWIKDSDWEKLIVDTRDYFTIVGRILDYILDPTAQHAQPNLINALSNSIILINEGCREKSSQLSVVKLVASLDALASGGKSNGIKKLISSRLGISELTPISSNGPTFQKAIDELYSEGRSRTIHGSSDKLYLDWTESKYLAEELARLTFMACIEWVSSNPGCNDANALKR